MIRPIAKSLLVAIAGCPGRPPASILPSSTFAAANFISKDPESCRLKWWHQVWNDLAVSISAQTGNGRFQALEVATLFALRRAVQWLGLD